MPVDIQALRDKKATFKLFDEQLTVEYRVIDPNSTNKEVEESEEKRGLTFDEIIRYNIRNFVKNRLLAWDLELDGKPIPIDPDIILDTVDRDILIAIIDGVNKDLSPNARAGKT